MSDPRPVRYWHGGVPGLRPGDAILPPCESATTRRLVNSAPHSPFREDAHEGGEQE